MTAPSDLATLAAVKSWLSVTSSADDALLSSLITAASRAIYAYLGRSSILPATYSEWYDGQGGRTLVLRRWPVLSVSQLVIDDTNVPAAASPFLIGGYRAVGFSLRPWDGQPPGRVGIITLDGFRFRRDLNNVAVTYLSGYEVANEAATVGVLPYQATARAPYGPWASDMGVVYAATGQALTVVSGAPAAWQYSVSSTGVYTFNSADAGVAVLISYGYIPQSLVQACIEYVGERYSYRARIGQRSKSIGGQETVSFDLGRPGTGMTDAVLGLLGPYRQVFPIDY